MPSNNGVACVWPTGREDLRNEGFDTLPKDGNLARLAHVQGEHGIVVVARLLDLGQLRQQEVEVHVVSPGVWLDAVRGKPADAEVGLRHARSDRCLLAFLR